MKTNSRISLNFTIFQIFSVIFSPFVDIEINRKLNFRQKFSESFTTFPESKKLSAPMPQVPQPDSLYLAHLV